MGRPIPAILTSRCGELVVSPDTRGTSVPHFHLTHAIGVNRSGGGTIHAMGKAWRFDVESVVVTNPRDSHWGEAGSHRLDYYLFYPDPKWLASLAFAEGRSGAFRFPKAVLPDPGLATALREAFQLLAESGGTRHPRGAVNALFAGYAAPEIERPASTTVGVGPEIDPAARIADWASSAGLSRAHYSREYQRITGLSPLNHRRQRRVLAARLLIESGASLADAAIEAGFSDQAHMTRQFRQILGLTPKSFAAQAEHKPSRLRSDRRG